MKKISLLLVFSILISCFCGFTYVYAGENDYVIYAPTGGGEWAPSTYNENGFSFGNAYDYAMIYEPGVLITGRTIANFTVDIEKSGKYELYFTIAGVNVPYSASVGSNSVSNATLQCPAFDSFERIKMADVMISGGTNIFSIINEGTGADTLFIKSMELIYIGSELSVEAITAEATDVLQTEEVPSSCDALTVEFSEEIGNTGEIELIMDGGEIPLEVSSNGKVLIISLKKSLVTGKNCTLKLTNIFDKNNILSTGDMSINFEVVEGTGTGSSLLVSDYSLTGEVFNVSGKVLSSKGLGISGRKVSLFEGNEMVVDTVSGENGVFEISYTVSQSVGMKNFTVGTEYSNDSIPVSALYAPEWAVNEFLNNFLQKETPELLMDFMAEPESEAILSIDVDADIQGISDTELVFSGLVGFSANSIGEIRDKYYKRIAMVRFMEADAEEIRVLLTNSDVKASLGIDEKMLEDIWSNADAISEDIDEISDITDEGLYAQRVTALMNKYALQKYSKANTAILADDANTYIGRSVNIPISLENAEADVKKIILKVSADNAQMLENITFATDGVCSIDDEEEYKVIEIIPQSTNVTELGILKLMSEASGDYTLSVSGNVVYEMGLEYELKSYISEKSIAIAVSADVPPEFSAEYGESSVNSENVEKITVGNGQAALIDGAEFIRIPVIVEQSGKYEIYIDAMSKTGSSVCVKTSIEPTESYDIPQTAGEYSDVGAYEKHLARTEYLGAGTHYISISNISGETAIKGVTLLKTEDKTAYRGYAPSSYNMAPDGGSISGVYASYYDDGSMMVGGTSYNLDVNVEKTGFYDIYVTAAAASGVNVAVSINGEAKFEKYWQTETFQDLKKEFVGTIGIPAGQTTISVTCVGTDADTVIVNCLDAILKSTELTADQILAGEDVIEENDQVKLSTDVLKIKLSSKINTDAIETKVKLTENGTSVPTMVSATGDTIEISLKKALQEGREYKLLIGGIYDSENTILMTPLEFSFTAGAEYINNASVLVTDSEMDGALLCIEGVVLSSKNIGISGRSVMLYSDGGQLIADCVSGADGRFELSYTLPENSQEGMHNFSVNTLYSESSVPVSEIYVTRDIEIQIINSLPTEQNAAAVKTVLEGNEYILNIDVSEDTYGINDTDTVFLAILNSQPKTVKKLRQEYKRAIIMAKINEASDIVPISAVLNDSEALKALEADVDMLADISDYRASLEADILNLTAYTDTKGFSNEISKLINKYALLKYSKSDAAITAQNGSSYIGKLLEIPVSADREISGAKEITLKIASPNQALLSALTFASSANTQADYSNGVLTVVIKPEGDITQLGKLSLVSYNVLSGSLSISGEVLYDEELDYELKSKLFEKNISIAVSENTNNFGGGGSSGGGRGSGSIGGVIGAAPDTEFEFNDLQSVAWAGDAIEYLLAKGVISESEDRSFRPNDFVTREEFVKMAVMALGVYDKNAQCDFNDVSSSSWCYSYVASAVQNGLITGYNNGNFGIGDNIKREDIAVILNRILGRMGAVKNEQSNEIFADDVEISSYAKADVYAVRNSGIINGVGANMFAPKDSATRAMSAKLIYEMMKAVGK